MAQFGPDIEEDSFGEEEDYSEFDENNIPDFGGEEDDSDEDQEAYEKMDGLYDEKTQKQGTKQDKN